MDKETKKISINKFQQALKNEHTPDKILEWNGLSIRIKYTISFQDVIDFVDFVSSSCFSGSDMQFTPEVMDFTIRSSVFTYYTNISLPLKASERYNLLYESNLYEIITGQYINPVQFETILKAIDRKIDNMCKNNSKYIINKINEVYDGFSKLQKMAESVINDIDRDSLNTVLHSLSNGEINEEKIVTAILQMKNNLNNTVE